MLYPCAAALFFSALLLVVHSSLPEKLPSPATSGSNSNPVSQDVVQVLLTILEKHSSGLPEELLEKLSFLRRLPPNVLRQAMEAYLPTLLLELSGESGGGGEKGANFLNVAQGLSHGLKPWADRLNEIGPALQMFLEAAQKSDCHGSSCGNDLAMGGKDEATLRNGSFGQHLDNVCYIDSPFHH